MAILLSAASDQVSVAHASSINSLTTWTWLLWLKTGTLATFKTLLDKRGAGGTVGYRVHSPGTGAGLFRAFVTTPAGDIAYRGSSGALSNNTWSCVAVTFDLNGSANQKINIYTGSLTAALTEVSYDSITDFTSTVSDDSGNNLVIANDGATTDTYPAAFAVAMQWNRVLTLAELIEQQWRPRRTSGCVIYHQLGYNGLSTQPDWSGNGNAGTVTGGAVADHVPLGPWFGFDREWAGSFTPVASGTVLLKDTFTTGSPDPNGTATTSHTMDTGPGWSQTIGVSDGQIQSSKLRANDTNTISGWMAESGQSDVTVSMTVQFDTANSSHRGGPIVRGLDSSNYWRAILYGDGTWELVEVAAGSAAVRASGSVAGVTSGVDYTIQVVTSAYSITATVDGANSINYPSASANLFYTKCGIYCHVAAADYNRLDNFNVWAGAAPVVAGTATFSTLCMMGVG